MAYGEKNIPETIFEEALAGYWDWNIHTGEEYLSPRFKQVLGYGKEEIENSFDAWQKLTHPDDLPGLLDHVQHYLEHNGDEPFRHEVRYFHKEGRVVWVICTGRVIEWSDTGSPLRMVGCHIDITEQKNAEAQVVRDREILSQAGKMARLGVWTKDFTNGDDYWSETTREIFEVRPGFRPDMKNALEFYREGIDRETITRVVTETIRSGTPYDVEVRIITARGNKRWVRTMGQAEFELGRCVRLYGTIQDITEAKTEAENRRILLDSIPTQVWFLTDETTYGAVNLAHAEYFGFRIEDMAFKNMQAFFPASVVEECRRGNARVFKEKTMIRTEEQVSNARGDVRLLEIFKVPSLDPEGNVKYVVCAAQDITDRVRAEREVRRLLAEKELLLHEVHHRIKNNMNTVASLLSLQIDASEDTFVGQTLADARNRLLSMEVLYEKLYRRELLDEMTLSEYLEPLIDEIRTVQQPDVDIAVHTDVAYISLAVPKLSAVGMIVNELLSNIFKHAFAGGFDRENPEITITATVIDEGGSPYRDGIQLIVEDNGRGFSNGIEPQEGFGMLLVRTLVEQLEGDFQFRSENGTCCTIRFPR